MAEGLTSTSDYAAQYEREVWIECDGTTEEIADALLPKLEADATNIEVPKRNGHPAGT